MSKGHNDRSRWKYKVETMANIHSLFIFQNYLNYLEMIMVTQLRWVYKICLIYIN